MGIIMAIMGIIMLILVICVTGLFLVLFTEVSLKKWSDVDSVLSQIYFGKHEIMRTLVALLAVTCFYISPEIYNTLNTQNRELRRVLESAVQADCTRKNTYELMMLMTENADTVKFSEVNAVKSDYNVYSFCVNMEKAVSATMEYSNSGSEVDLWKGRCYLTLAGVRLESVRDEYIWQGTLRTVCLFGYLAILFGTLMEMFEYRMAKGICKKKGLL